MGPAGKKNSSSKELSLFAKDDNLSRRAITNFKLNFVIKLQSQFGDFVPPLHHANPGAAPRGGAAGRAGTAKIFLEIDVLKLGKGFNPVEVEMIERSFFGGVLMEKSKRGRGDKIFRIALHPPKKAPHKGCFSGAQIAAEGDDVPLFEFS